MRTKNLGLAGLFAALLASAACAVTEPPAERPWRVVILNDGDSGLPAFVAIDRALRVALTASGTRRVDFFPESLDMLRFSSTLHEGELVALFEKKYAGQHIDAVVAIGASSLDFAEKHRSRVWSDAYVLFTGVPVETLRTRKLSQTTTGFPTQHDLAGAVGLALRLRPSTRRVIVIAGSGEFDRLMARVAREQLADYAKRLHIEYWQDLSIDEYRRRVTQLDRDDAVLYLAIIRDGEGRPQVSPQVAKSLSAISPAPFYGPLENLIGQGIVAGTVYSFEARGRRIAGLMNDILSTRPSGPLPLGTPGQSSCMADARQLERFGMSRSLLPADCEVRFSELSLWGEYRWHVFAALAAIALQSLLIAALIVQRRQHRTAEIAARQHSVELAHSLRLATIGEMTAAISHEINQPLGAILGNADAAEMLLESDAHSIDQLRHILADIRRDDLRASEVVKRLRAFLQKHETERKTVDLNELVADTLRLVEAEGARRSVELDVQTVPGSALVSGDRIQLQQLMINLIINSMDAMEETPVDERKVTLQLYRPHQGKVEIAVIDVGHGIEAGASDRVFESFYTTKQKGLGLGLSIARTIVEGHGGTIRAQHNLSGGAIFRVTLPEAEPEPACLGIRAETAQAGAE